MTSKKEKPQETVTIPKSWLETLEKYYDRWKDRPGSESLDMLLGYLSSIKSIKK